MKEYKPERNNPAVSGTRLYAVVILIFTIPLLEKLHVEEALLILIQHYLPYSKTLTYSQVSAPLGDSTLVDRTIFCLEIQYDIVDCTILEDIVEIYQG